MLCTVVYDTYTADEASEIHAALKRLLSPDQPDWSPKGVYAYWDRESHDLLYLGLAGDLPTRFAQHNGLVSHQGGNKKEEIDEYFSEYERLGFTVLIQSKAVQIQEQIAEIDFTLGTTADQLIAVGEGQLIETHRRVHGARPAWNRTGGSRDGKRWATSAPALLDVLAARRPSLFAARCRLRVLSADFRLRFFESTIHASRMRAMMEAHQLLAPPPDGREETFLRIQRLLMLRDGHLVDDLEASDDDICRWLELLGKPEHWREEAAMWRGRFDPSTLSRPEREVRAFLDSTILEAAPPEHILATRAIFQSGYLDQESELL